MKHALRVSLFWLMAVGVVTAQDRRITGKVIASDDSSPLPGVSVLLKGSNRGTTTDASGNYSLPLSASGGNLVFSFVGFTTLDVEIGNQTVVDVKLVADSRQLSEVVVTGVGVATSKAKLGIDVASLTNEKLAPTPVPSLDQALAGRIAGAQITSTSGNPGARANILFRGINTINSGTSPIVLMDGVQVGATDLNTLDLSNIERVEVIQGAAAGTIYGAQGANGVIQLFTKRGKEGPLQVNVSSGITNNTFLNIGGVAKSRFHSFVTNDKGEVIGTSGNPLVLDEATSTYRENVQYNPLGLTSNANKPYDKNLKFYDAYDTFFKPANMYTNSVSVSGAGPNSDFNVAVSNFHQESNLKNNGAFDRTNIVTNLGMTLAKNLTVRSVTQLAYTKNTQNNSDRTVLYALNNTRPFADYEYKDPDGNYANFYGTALGPNSSNPNYYSQYRQQAAHKIDMVQSLNLNYKPVKFLEFDAKYGLNFQREDTRRTFANQTQNRNIRANPNYYIATYGSDATGEIDNFEISTVFQNFLGQAIFRTDFQEDFNLNIPIKTSTQVAFDYRNTKYKEYNTYGLGFPLYQPVTAASATTYRILTDYTQPFVTYGYLVNQRIEYGEIAGISAGFRSDYSSAFGRGSTPFTFPRGDAYLRLSSMGFWQGSKVGDYIPEFKLRAAYGEAGVQPKAFDRYVTLSPRTLGTDAAIYYAPAQKNPDLQVEVSRELEIGTDFTIAAGKGDWLRRLNFSMSYWNRTTDNAIYDVDVAPSTAIGSLKDNAFSLGSHGFQASLNATVFRSPKFTWNLTTNFGKQTSEIKSIKNGFPIVRISSAGSTNYILKAGEKIGQLYGFKILTDVAATKPDGTPHIAEANRSNFEVASNGYVVDKRTKQPFFTAEQYALGDPNPKFNMAFINDFTFSDFLTFSFQVDWIHGSHIYNQTKSWMYRDGIHANYAEPLTINGETGAWTAFYRGVYAQRSANGTKDYFYEDASFVRLRNISLGIDLAKIVKLPTRRLQLVLAGRNLLTFTKYTGFDPEVSSGSTTGNENSAWDRGTDHNTLPNFRSYSATLNIGF